MRPAFVLIGVAGLALSSSLALAGGPEDLLPPMFRNPPPQQAAPTPSPSAARPVTPGRQVEPPPAPGGGAVVQTLPVPAGEAQAEIALPANFPSLEELEAMEDDEINDLLGLRPKFDIPAGARHAVAEIGVLDEAEGGFPVGSLRGQPASLVRAALAASQRPIVSRWGHILMRRALASRLDAPRGLNPVEFAALRAQALANMGEGAVARALVQDVDGSEYNSALTNAAFDAYLATGDVLGMCPVARLHGDIREDGEWEMLRAICTAYQGEARAANRQLDRALGTGVAPAIDVRLAQRYAGAAGDAGQALNIEWDGVEELTPWRAALARALGEDLPVELRSGAGTRYDIMDALIPATPLLARVAAADTAGGRGVLSSAAMVDLYSQLHASDALTEADKAPAELLREAYVAQRPSARLDAMRQLWGNDGAYGRQVLTAYAAARLPVSEAMAGDAGDIIASMLTAGLDRNAQRWSNVVAEGSLGWALLTLVQTDGAGQVDAGAVDSFIGDDSSTDARKSAFLVAGLAGLGRLSNEDGQDLSAELEIDLTRRSAWSDKIARAAETDNAALVALLAGLGMQGESWDQMTPRHLFHIVRALNNVGLSAEARMIAAEAVARG